MKYLFLATMMALSLACSKSDDKKGGDGGKPKVDGPVATGFDEKATDFSHCAGAPATGSSITAHSWNSTADQQGILLAQKLVITENSVSLALKCTVDGKSVIAELKVNAKVTADSIEILSDGADSQDLATGEGQKITCSVGPLKTGMLVNYTFRGPCLAILGQQENLFFVPAQ